MVYFELYDMEDGEATHGSKHAILLNGMLA